MTTRATRLLSPRTPVVGLVALASFAALAAGSAAAPARHAATHKVTIALSDAGIGNWSDISNTEKTSVAMKYDWKGSATFAVPATKTFSLKGTATLVGNWTGDYHGTRFEGQPYPGDFRCSYTGASVRVRVVTQLISTGGKTVDLVVNNDHGFFAVKGAGVKTDCTNAIGADGPPHFSPSWLFRDSFNDHNRLSSSTAFMTLPRSVLSGATATTRFPNEVGSSTVTLTAELKWHNVGRLTATPG